MNSLRNELVEQLVRELWHDPTQASRNRHFQAFQGDLGRRALRCYRLLRSLRRELLLADRVTVERDGRGTSVMVELHGVHARRRVSLTPRLFALLQDDEELRHRLPGDVAAGGPIEGPLRGLS
ncbi:MAG: hypothetical protein ABIJ09_23475 [Pseudomonadota bacterium]